MESPELRLVYGRVVITDIEQRLDPSQRELRYLIRRKYTREISRMDETSRVPEWLNFQKVRQGSE